MMRQTSSSGAWRSIRDALAHHAALRPGQAALVDVDRHVSVSFGELPAVIDSLALQMQAQGLRHGTRVVLLMDRPVETLCIWLALWRIGAVVCPMDRAQLGSAVTQEAITTIGPQVILRGSGWGGEWGPDPGAPSLTFGQWPGIEREVADLRFTGIATPEDRRFLGPGPAMGDLAAICCTSGTSGHLKIILHDHGSYWLNGLDSQTLLGLTSADRMLEYRSFSWYSPQILSLMPMLQTGISLHVASEFSASRFVDWVIDHAITVAVGVPTVLNILLRQPKGRIRPCAASLRLMTSSSAPLSSSTWAQFERETGIPIVNLYGTSEGGWLCGNQVDNRLIGSVGHPTSGVRLKLVDSGGQEVGCGEIGEVVVEGEKLALGMLQHDGNVLPIRGRPFFTHDIGQQDELGVVRILGRQDQLIIRGGVKIAPAQIEDAMLHHPDVAEAAATAVPDDIYGQEIVCFVVLKPGAEQSPAALMGHASELLASDRRPKAIVQLDELPRNGRGKIRIDVLRRWAQSMANRDNELNSPHAPMSNSSLPLSCA